MFNSYAENRNVRNHSDREEHSDVGRYAGHNHLFAHQSLDFRVKRPASMRTSASSRRNLNAIQMNVKQNLHGIPWTAAIIGAKG